jgi:hypothetical protein
MTRLEAVGAFLTTALVAGCGTSSPTAGDGADDRVKSGVFVAVSEDFRGFHSWDAFDVTGGAADAGIHDGSNVMEYLSSSPKSGAKEFPLGTIIVKEATGGTIAHEIFAMVKRGGGYNSVAHGWEWFDLLPTDDGKDGWTIHWRGFSAPAGDMYGGDINGGCNTCHRDCGNDAVCAKELALSNF